MSKRKITKTVPSQATIAAVRKRVPRGEAVREANARAKAKKNADQVNATPPEATTAPEPQPEPTPAPQAAEPAAKPRGLLDAAAIVLRDAGAEKSASELVAMAEAAGLWQRRAGKTPEATLYSAIIREIAAKGDGARFKKAGPGRFEAA